MKPGQDLAEFGSELEGDDALFTALVRGVHAENAAAIARISERTVYRRLADPIFRGRVDQARELLRESILARLTDAGLDAIGALETLMHESEDDRVRMQSAKTLLESLTALHASLPRTKTTSVLTVKTEQETNHGSN